VRGEDYFGIVRTAELEATEAERHTLKLRNTVGPDLNESQSYAITLKRLINFLRYGFVHPHLKDYQYSLFKILCEEMTHKNLISSRCKDTSLH
jgi:hypothetical protein